MSEERRGPRYLRYSGAPRISFLLGPGCTVLENWSRGKVTIVLLHKVSASQHCSFESIAMGACSECAQFPTLKNPVPT